MVMAIRRPIWCGINSKGLEKEVTSGEGVDSKVEGMSGLRNLMAAAAVRGCSSEGDLEPTGSRKRVDSPIEGVGWNVMLELHGGSKEERMPKGSSVGPTFVERMVAVGPNSKASSHVGGLVKKGGAILVGPKEGIDGSFSAEGLMVDGPDSKEPKGGPVKEASSSNMLNSHMNVDSIKIKGGRDDSGIKNSWASFFGSSSGNFLPYTPPSSVGSKLVVIPFEAIIS